jgi:cobalt-zinc-cadmium efflux system membrane fusion protein
MATITHSDQPQSKPNPFSAPEQPTPSVEHAPSGLRNMLPTLAVIVALVGIGLWGHFSHWTMPKFSALVGSAAPDAAPWCKEHNVPESICIECNTKLLPRGEDFGFCKVHGVAQCPLEHPEVAELAATPTVTPEMLDRAKRALDLKPRPENDSRCTLHTHRIQFASTEAMTSPSFASGRSSKP